MKQTQIFLIGLLFCIKVSAQEHNTFYQTLVNQVNSDTIEENLTDFVGFGEKQMGSTASQNALNWLIGLYESWGYTDIEQDEVNYAGQTGYNLIVTKQGTVYPDTYVIVDGHYDTLGGPGANDNGSGTSVILELARILKDIPTEYSIKFIHFTAEEWGLVGSYQYVEDIDDLDVRLVFNIDQVGGVSGDVNDTVTCDSDQSPPNSNNSQSSVFTNQLVTSVELYSDLETEIGPAYGSDYVPFQESGFVITGLYENNESPYPHSSQDTMSNLDLDYIFQVAKGALGALCYFAKVQESMGVGDVSSDLVRAFPNPVDKLLTIQTKSSEKQTVQLADLSGKVVYKGSHSGTEMKIDTSVLSNGVYILNYSDGKSVSTQKIIVQH